MLELLAILDAETTIATKTKLNSDFVPGMVTVLNGEELEALGLRTVWEALSLVPGIQAYRNAGSDPMYTIRGLQFPFNSGNIKVMLNSIAMSREDSGINSPVSLLPVEQVKRIEFIRGPGSSLYGSYAFMGLLNIITRDEGAGAYGAIEAGDVFRGGFRYSWSDPERELRFSASVSALDSSGGIRPLGADTDESRLFSILSASYRKSVLTAQVSTREFTTTGRGDRDSKNWAVNYRQGLTFSESLEAQVSLSYLHNDNTSAISTYIGDIVEGELDLSWSGIPKHKLLLGLSFAHSEVEEAALRQPFPLPEVRILGIDWRTISLSLQDQFELKDSFTLTGGLRYDHRDDTDESLFTHRIAAVLQVGDYHIFKAQFAKGFRSPTFFELHSSDTPNFAVESESVETAEVGYIFRRPGTVARATFFTSTVNDMIFPQIRPGRPPPGGPPPLPVFDNSGEARSKGIELGMEPKTGRTPQGQLQPLIRRLLGYSK